MRIALANIKQACAQLGIAYADFFPSISLINLLGPASIDIRRLFKLSTGFWLGQVVANTTLFNLNSYQSIKAAKAGLQATILNSLQTLQSVFKDVDDKLTTEQKNQDIFSQIKKNYVATKKSYFIAKTQYQAGSKDNRTAINAKINLDKAKLSLIQQKAALLDSIVQVFNAIAAGDKVSPCQHLATK